MHRLHSSAGFALTLALVLLGAPGGALAAERIYSWETEEGTLAFTDDPKQIPARYRGAATSRAREDLGRYPRASISDAASAVPHADRLARRLAYLRNANGAVAIAAPGIPGQASSEAAFLVRTSGSSRGVSTQVGFAVSEGPPGASPEPIVTDNVRVKPADSDATRHITVVRQGDKILSVVKPQLNQTSVVFDTEEEALRAD